MNKLVFKDSTVIENLLEMNGFNFTITGKVEDTVTIYNELNESNLEKIEVKDENDNVLSVWENKKLSSISYSDGKITVNLSDIDMVAKRLADVENTLDALMMEDLGA